MPVLDFGSSFFGDSVYMYIGCDESYCWKYTFDVCYKVNYETDAGWKCWRKPNLTHVSKMKKGQLGYYSQNITVTESEYSNFYQVDIDLSLLSARIICQDVNIEKIKLNDVCFFWHCN